MTWQDSALCTQVGPYLWDIAAEDGRTTEAKQAKAICRTCPVMEQCALYALDTGIEFGIYGAMGPRDRRKVWEGKTDAAVVIRNLKISEKGESCSK